MAKNVETHVKKDISNREIKTSVNDNAPVREQRVVPVKQSGKK